MWKSNQVTACAYRSHSSTLSTRKLVAAEKPILLIDFNGFMTRVIMCNTTRQSPCLWTFKLLDSGSVMMGKQRVRRPVLVSRLLCMTHNNII